MLCISFNNIQEITNGDNENILKLDCGNACKTLFKFLIVYFPKFTELYLKLVNFMACQLCLNKASKKMNHFIMVKIK